MIKSHEVDDDNKCRLSIKSSQKISLGFRNHHLMYDNIQGFDAAAH